ISSKTLTIPKGVSLMQVFRDNHLNISDVNAMSKANKAVSNLKVGEKVTVRLDKNSRVVEMRINAGIYTRQSNGAYIFK
ncbi:3-ketoacyl-ACP reductase, partial [Glaesserella parasuis]|nr:3-ketoacyl-ACP reductase [Glaesserella parasuis]MDE3937771.1 3-ketoacyl-ACP reductase [Glaesserella parasuis]